MRAAALVGAGFRPRLQRARAQLGDRALGRLAYLTQDLLELVGRDAVGADDGAAEVGIGEDRAARADVLLADRLIQRTDRLGRQLALAGELARGEQVEPELELAVLDPPRNRR